MYGMSNQNPGIFPFKMYLKIILLNEEINGFE